MFPGEHPHFFKETNLIHLIKEAPELCVEIISPSNSAAEIEEKTRLWLSKGAKEVWVCEESGRMKFCTCRGEADKSLLFPAMPDKVEL